ncbi:MAG: glycosyltransferase [Alphaproteobacteria bacterium]|nr:glycosyltransferase [Alphaproteobacteria bacterium]
MLFIKKIFKHFKRKRIKGSCCVAIVDDSIPNPNPCGFRNYEFNLILDSMPNANIWTMSKTYPGSDAWFEHAYGQQYRLWKKNKKAYLLKVPQNKGRLYWLNTQKAYSFDLAYSIFLCTTYTLLPFYEKNNIPFVFVLYPGGGFGLNNASSDAMLKKVFQSPCFRGVVCTQPITCQYIIDKKFVTKDKILYQFGGYLQFLPNDVGKKICYPKDKPTLDICFVAYKYSPKGVDKGYDLFIKVAKKLVLKYDFIRFHVVGNFDANDIPIDSLESKIYFHGLLDAKQLQSFYSGMDICLSPNRPFKLFEGNFDGFPLGLDAMCFGVVLMLTDELKNNQGNYIDGEELIIIRPEEKDILSKIEPLIENISHLYKIGRNGAEKTFKILNPKNRANAIIKFLKQNLMEPK